MSIPDKLPDQSWKAVLEQARPEEVEVYLIDEIFKALGLRADSRWRAWFGHIFTPLVRSFAHKAVEFDQTVGRYGFRRAAQEWLRKWLPGLRVIGKEQLPLDGPLLIAANHPGTYDGLAVASAVSRQDLRIVASGNPFFRALPNTRQYFIYATRDIHVRVATIRNALRHLQSGGALLIFPYGRVEPDPLHYLQAAKKSLARWSASLKLILDKVPQVRLVIAINAGFVAHKYLYSPLARLRPRDEERQILAEFIQVIQQVIFDRRISDLPSVIFSEPLSLPELAADEEGIKDQIISTASRLLDRLPSGSTG